jgi:hypothetical protein
MALKAAPDTNETSAGGGMRIGGVMIALYWRHFQFFPVVL